MRYGGSRRWLIENESEISRRWDDAIAEREKEGNMMLSFSGKTYLRPEVKRRPLERDQ